MNDRIFYLNLLLFVITLQGVYFVPIGTVFEDSILVKLKYRLVQNCRFYFNSAALTQSQGASQLVDLRTLWYHIVKFNHCQINIPVGTKL